MDSSVVLYVRGPDNVYARSPNSISEEQQPLLANSDRKDESARPALASNVQAAVLPDQTAGREMLRATHTTRASLINAKSDLRPCYRVVNTIIALFFGYLGTSYISTPYILRESLSGNWQLCKVGNHTVMVGFTAVPMANTCLNFAIMSAILVVTCIAGVFFTKLAISRFVKACRSPAKLVILREYDKNVLTLRSQKASALFKKNPEVQAGYKAAEKAHEQLWNEAVKALKKNDDQANVKVIADFSIRASRANAEYAAVVDAAASKEG